jgi:hypothetical protein
MRLSIKKTTIKKVIKLNKERKVDLLKGSLITIVGYILSPLSWWNDAVVNIPIALALAKITTLIIKVDFYKLFVLYYWFTNFVGLIMMYMGGEIAIRGDNKKKLKDIVISLIFSVVYTLVVTLILKILGF